MLTHLPPQSPCRYLALGDSYTIGESVPVEDRWPVQLAAGLRRLGLPTAAPEIIARTGWTTDELMAGIRQALPQGPYDLVSLLIGVNNQYRGRNLDEYSTSFHSLLVKAISLAGQRPERVLVLSIPDWGVTPFAHDRDAGQISTEINRFNQVNRQAAQQAGAAYFDITPLSRQAAGDPSWLADDGLHPSGKMYAAWAALVLPVAQQILSHG
jgi:lysophospholipase L1-like esterase